MSLEINLLYDSDPPNPSQSGPTLVGVPQLFDHPAISYLRLHHLKAVGAAHPTLGSNLGAVPRGTPRRRGHGREDSIKLATRNTCSIRGSNGRSSIPRGHSFGRRLVAGRGRFAPH